MESGKLLKIKNYMYKNSLFLQNIDKFILLSIILVYVSSTFLSSDVIGFLALVTIFLSVIKYLFQSFYQREGEQVLNEPANFRAASKGAKLYEIFLIAYFMVVIISLAGSTLFHLSLKGFFKTFTYIMFYFSIAQYIKTNKDKLVYIFTSIALCAGFESIIGFLQNFAQVSEISTWQDVSNLNPEQVMTRVYGTLKPYNPNLLGGYFVAAIPFIYGLSAYFFVDKKYKFSILSFVLALISTLTLFLTGCRGSYIGMLVIAIGIFSVSAKYLWNNYKQIYLSVVGCVTALVTSALLFIGSLRARVLSMFAMRQDSSNSFRFNVYHSSLDMFRDNWLLGIGVGNQNFREIYGLYMKTGFDALSAYNIFLEIAVESGIFALIAFLGFLICYIKDAVQFIKKSTDTKTVILVSAGLISVLGVCFHGLVDTVFFRPQIQMLFWTAIAVLQVI